MLPTAWTCGHGSTLICDLWLLCVENELLQMNTYKPTQNWCLACLTGLGWIYKKHFSCLFPRDMNAALVCTWDSDDLGLIPVVAKQQIYLWTVKLLIFCFMRTAMGSLQHRFFVSFFCAEQLLISQNVLFLFCVLSFSFLWCRLWVHLFSFCLFFWIVRF